MSQTSAHVMQFTCWSSAKSSAFINAKQPVSQNRMQWASLLPAPCESESLSIRSLCWRLLGDNKKKRSTKQVGPGSFYVIRKANNSVPSNSTDCPLALEGERFQIQMPRSEVLVTAWNGKIWKKRGVLRQKIYWSDGHVEN